MNTKNNKRRQQTREKIENEFLALLQKTDITKISVSDICKRTGYNRSTFYANYEDIYALANAIREKLEADVISLFNNDITSNWRESDYLRLFEHIRDNQLIYKTYFKLGFDTVHKIDFSELHREYSDFFGEHLEYHVEFFKAGFNAMLKKWLAGGCRESPEEMSEILKKEYFGRK